MMSLNENGKRRCNDLTLRKLILPPKEVKLKPDRPGLLQNRGPNPDMAPSAAPEEQQKARLDSRWKRQPLGPGNARRRISTDQSISDENGSKVRRKMGTKREALASSATDHVGTADRSFGSVSVRLLADVEDIDADDGDNLILMSEYVNDIYDYLYELEEQHPINLDRFDSQLEVTPKMRAVLVDWINEMHYQFHLEIETFYLAVAIIDRYIQVEKNTTRSNFQLVGVSALFIASKYEELFPPSLNDFVYIMDSAGNASDIKQMERQILKAIDGNLSRPLPIHFLRRFAKAGKAKHEHYALAKYFMELSCVDHELASCKPSKVAAASLSLSLHLIDGNPYSALSFFSDKHWTPTLIHYSRYTAANLRMIERRIAKLVRDAPTSALKSIYTKFESSTFLKVALRPELNGALMESMAGKR